MVYWGSRFQRVRVHANTVGSRQQAGTVLKQYPSAYILSISMGHRELTGNGVTLENFKPTPSDIPPPSQTVLPTGTNYSNREAYGGHS